MRYRVEQLASACDVSVDTVRYYQSRGLLPPPEKEGRVAWYGDILPTRDFPTYAAWYEQGKLDLDRVVTRVYSLEESEEAFHAMERGETLRGVIRI